jgi:hypothetical protein
MIHTQILIRNIRLDPGIGKWQQEKAEKVKVARFCKWGGLRLPEFPVLQSQAFPFHSQKRGQY